MAYQLNAILGELKRLQTAASATLPAVIVPLAGELGLIPLTEELFEAVNKGSEGNYEAEERHFTYLSTQIARWLQWLSVGTTIAYVEADYFGGLGTQCAVAWKDGVEVLPPTKAEGKAKGAINHALGLLGVRAAVGKDEFDTVDLGRHRKMEDWVEAAGRSLKEDIERQRLKHSWRITRGYLENAVDLLPERFLNSAEGKALTRYEWLGYNELELALDELERLGDVNDAPTAFWAELLAAAKNMALANHVERYKKRCAE